MSDIFNNNVLYGGTFRANKAALTFSNQKGEGLGLLVQGVQARYSQAVTRAFEIGPENRTYFIIGRAAGQLSLERIAGPFEDAEEFIRKFSDPCQIANNTISLRDTNDLCQKTTAGASYNARRFSYNFNECIANTLGIAITAGDMVIRESVIIDFVSMEYKNPTSSTTRTSTTRLR